MSSHILIIDDDLPTLEMMRSVLEIEGRYQVTVAQVLFEDLSEIERLQPDLILLDLTFGGRRLGWDFFQQLRRSRTTMRIPVIICTAAFNEARKQETRCAGGLPWRKKRQNSENC
ncbi:MAG TPA: response regulator [Ktedonobacteraceae bacterium]|nr:response regulator [Ktedonobacteraceae bacterium]